MQKNTFMFVLCTTVFLIIWFMFFQPKQDAQLIVENPVNSQQNQEVANNNQNLNINSKETVFSGILKSTLVLFFKLSLFFFKIDLSAELLCDLLCIAIYKTSTSNLFFINSRPSFSFKYST